MPITTSKTCVNCKRPFAVREEDRHFFQHLDLPEPTWCPDCRLKRRLVFVAEGAPRVAPEARDLREYSRAYRFERPFFEQYRELQVVASRGAEVPETISALLGYWRQRAEQYQSIAVVARDEPRRAAVVEQSVNCLGNFLDDCASCRPCVLAEKCERVRHGMFLNGISDSCDVTLAAQGSLLYEVVAGTGELSRCFFSAGLTGKCRNIEYSYQLTDCTSCFGCVGLVGASYCILNRQYGEQEYAEYVDAIHEQMMDEPFIDEPGHAYRDGEFFPPEFSPFQYHETLASAFFPVDTVATTADASPWSFIVAHRHLYPRECATCRAAIHTPYLVSEFPIVLCDNCYGKQV